VGDWCDVSQLPEFLGNDVAERVTKWIAYKKGGVALIDTSQEGRAYNANTVYAGYDDSLRVNAIQAIELAIERIENTCSSITGVFRERLNGIQQKDAVSNVNTGVRNSFTITKQYYQQMDCLVQGLLLDVLDTAKIVYKKGLTGELILGDKGNKIFTALPEHFTVSDYDVHIPPSSEILREMQNLKEWTAELIKAGVLPPDMLMSVISAKSLTQLKSEIAEATKKVERKNNQLQQLTQQNEQLQEQLKQMQQELQKAAKKLEQLNEQDLQLKQKELDHKIQLDWFNARYQSEQGKETLEVKKRQVDAELAQLYDNNPRNDEVRNIGWQS